MQIQQARTATISVSPQVNVAIRSSLQSLREKIEELRELLLRAVSTRQMYPCEQHPCPSGLWGTVENVLSFLCHTLWVFPSLPLQTLSPELSLCCWLLCSRQLQRRKGWAPLGQWERAWLWSPSLTARSERSLVRCLSHL